jgi:hypothetical protein
MYKFLFPFFLKKPLDINARQFQEGLLGRGFNETKIVLTQALTWKDTSGRFHLF